MHFHRQRERGKSAFRKNTWSSGCKVSRLERGGLAEDRMVSALRSTSTALGVTEQQPSWDATSAITAVN